MEERYKYSTPSTMKPTQMTCSKNGLNQIPQACTISGDVRLTPFYKTEDVQAAVLKYVEEMNADLTTIPTMGPVSKYELPVRGAVCVCACCVLVWLTVAGVLRLQSGIKGKLTLRWADTVMPGVACNLDSPGFAALCDSVKAIKGDVKPCA